MSYFWSYASRKVSLTFLVFVPHGTNFWDEVTCRVVSVIHKTTRSAQEYNVNMYVIEKQMLEFEQDLSVSGLYQVVHFTISSVGHITAEKLQCNEQQGLSTAFTSSFFSSPSANGRW